MFSTICFKFLFGTPDLKLVSLMDTMTPFGVGLAVEFSSRFMGSTSLKVSVVGASYLLGG